MIRLKRAKIAPQSFENLQMWWGAQTCSPSSVKCRDLRSHILHKALSNLAILLNLMRFFQQNWRIFSNLSMSKVEKKKKKRGKFYFFLHRMSRQADQHFDDILRCVGEFGLWQKFLYFSSCFLVIVSSAIQIASLVFATGTPKFHCVTPNVTCDENKCCAECTSYAFDQSFTSTVTQVRIGFISCFVTVSAVWTWKRGGRVQF